MVASLQTWGRLERDHAIWSALAARYRYRPPRVATSRLTVEGGSTQPGQLALSSQEKPTGLLLGRARQRRLKTMSELPAWVALLTPLVLAIVGFALSRQLNRNSELIRLRVEYYKVLLPDLNTLMCYMTFIGTWVDHSPIEIIALKRGIDSTAHSALPLYTPQVAKAYDQFMDVCFEPFGAWGSDALIQSGPYPRRRYWRREDQAWSNDWDDMFTKRDTEAITGEELKSIRLAYDSLVARLVDDLKVTKARTQYTTNEVTLNAVPDRDDIPGWVPDARDRQSPGWENVSPFHSTTEDETPNG